ncbi:fragile x mental retardation protein [Stylonychia lemnae]|uniref:Fragile x mental retardation protein n=1 Tax=Stylonychia lemnae TaxID=5949 RepID=A0A078AG29_STYLE|nr:fragile x mental retardation protein [Stylonychia lemnae]|eukprot:CDW81270.1 fragile x mental retardation protein [Stylonychia lemnae]
MLHQANLTLRFLHLTSRLGSMVRSETSQRHMAKDNSQLDSATLNCRSYLIRKVLIDTQSGGMELNANQHQIRWRTSLPTNTSDEEYQTYDLVEAYCRSNRDEIDESIQLVHGWRRATVKSVKGNYAYLEFDRVHHPDQLSQIYPIRLIRRLSELTGPNPDLFYRTEVLIHPDLHQWVFNLDKNESSQELLAFNDQLAIITRTSQVYGISLSQDKQRLVVLGPQERLRSATLAVDIFLNHQRQVINIDATPQQSKTNPASQKQQARVKNEIFVDSSLVGLIVGQGGMSLKRIQDQYNVKIEVEQQRRDNQLKKVTIYGNSIKEVQAASSEVNIMKVLIDVPNEHLDYVLGKNDENIEYFTTKSCVITLDVTKKDDFNHNLVAVGTQQAVDDLKMIVNTHLQYFSQYQQRETLKQNTVKRAMNVTSEQVQQNNGNEQQHQPVQQQQNRRGGHYQENSNYQQQQNSNQFYRKK